MRLNRNWLVLISLFLLLATTACTLNKVTPAAADEEAMEADVRRAVLGAVPGKTFGIEVKVDDGIVTLSGNVGSEDDRRRIAEAAQKVDGVRSVINNLQVQ
jgi:osmotically-inducible protein OsmY